MSLASMNSSKDKGMRESQAWVLSMYNKGIALASKDTISIHLSRRRLSLV